MADKCDKPTYKITVKASDCPITQVTVYKERAEVCRRVETAVKPGISEIYITEFVEIDKDSIRVEGKGNAIIAEVSFHCQFVTDDEATTTEKVRKMKEELNKLQEEKINLDYASQKTILAKRWNILDNFGNTVSRNGQTDNCEPGKSLHLDSAFFASMKEFIKQYHDIATSLENDRRDLTRKNEELEKKINVAESNLNKLQDGTTGINQNRECLIVLEAECETKVQLFVSYVVLQASWTPLYDLRMLTDQGILKIFYYGLIRQNSNEDWNDVKLFLSTAQPSIGGVIPALPTMHLTRHRVHQITVRRFKLAQSRPPCFACFISDSTEPEPKTEHVLGRPEVQVKEGITSASFEIARLYTIPSDNTEHKVAIAVIDLKPALSYVTVPKIIPHAFLKAKVTNESEYTLLAGKTNIFLDNSFVAKAKINSVAPKEEFECSLGMDPGVRINYKPLVKMNSSSGVISKTRCITQEQTIEIKNLHDYSIKIKVRDNLPRSTEDKIKVNLISPEIDIKHPDKTEGVKLTKSNHVEWDLDIKGLDKEELVFKYTVEHPANERVRAISEYEEE